MTHRAKFVGRLLEAFEHAVELEGNFAVRADAAQDSEQRQTNSVFSEKWGKYQSSEDKEKLFEFQRRWYLKLYGFESERALAERLRASQVIFDAGCGLGYKAAWFAELAPHALVIGMDFSDAAAQAARNYGSLDN